MSTLRIESNEDFAVEVEIRESDERTGLVYVKFDRQDSTEGTRRCSEMFLTTQQLEKMARFMLRQADEVHTAQVNRK